LVGDAALAKAASDKLLAEHNIYVQSINYPTVAVGEERLRITVTPRHTLEQMDKLVRAVDKIFTELGINRLSVWKNKGGCAGLVLANTDEAIKPLWNDEQLGLHNGTTPRTLRNGQPATVDAKAVNAARGRFSTLLGPIGGGVKPTYPIEDALVNTTFKMKAGLGVRLAAEQVQTRIPLPATATVTA
jgi:5-aminolevulinate synthase